MEGDDRGERSEKRGQQTSLCLVTKGLNVPVSTLKVGFYRAAPRDLPILQL